MKTRISGCVVLVITMALVAGCGGPSARVEVNPDMATYKVKTVAILPFEGVPVAKETEEFSGWWQDNFPNNGETISDMLATALIGAGGFSYIERSQVRKILEEQGLAVSDLIHKRSASEIGKLLGADAVVLGAVGKMRVWVAVANLGQGCDLSFSARMVHTETGIILWSVSVNRKEGTADVLGIARQECRTIGDQLRTRLTAKPSAQ